MRRTFRARLLLIVALSVAALGAMAVVDLFSVRRVQRLLDAVEDNYLPLMELAPEVQSRFTELRRGMQDAVAAQDREDLDATRAARDSLQDRINTAPAIVDRQDVETLLAAVDDWYRAAFEVASRLINSEVGENLVEDIEAMQARQQEVERLISETLVLDRALLEEGFAVLRSAQSRTFQVRMVVRAALAVMVTLLALGIVRRMRLAIRDLASGFARFGRGDFDKPIAIAGDDEFSELALDANRMAVSLLDLDERLRRRQADLERANKELEAFSYSVSHDLRAPLRGIDGFSLALMEDYAESLPPEAQHYLQRVRAAAQRMGQLIDDLLQLSRLNRGEIRRESVDLSGMAQEVAAELSRANPGREVEVSIAHGLRAGGDGRLLRIVMENLLGNAWKFTTRSEHPRVEIGALEQEGETVFFVRDNGAGFDMRRADQLFTPFKRLHHDKEYPGTGIGLAIVQRVIHRHGGRVWAKGEVNRGATFFFTVPQGSARDGDDRAALSNGS